MPGCASDPYWILIQSSLGPVQIRILQNASILIQISKSGS